jgi:hypothetical protein
MAGGLNEKLFCFVEITHEPLHLDKGSLMHLKIMDILARLFESLTSLLNMAMVRNVEVILGQNLNYSV